MALSIARVRFDGLEIEVRHLQGGGWRYIVTLRFMPQTQDETGRYVDLDADDLAALQNKRVGIKTERRVVLPDFAEGANGETPTLPQVMNAVQTELTATAQAAAAWIKSIPLG